MQLTYRGVAYQLSATSIELPVSAQTGKYRGHTSRIAATVLVSRQTAIALKYRGVAYPLIQSDENTICPEAIAV